MADGWRRRWSRRVALVLALVLAVTLADVPVWSRPVSAAPAKPPAKPECPSERADAVSAMVTAKLCGKRIEVLGERSETSQVWALPEGGFSRQVFAAPVRFKQGDVWTDIDLTLRKAADGSVGAVAHPNGLWLTGAVKPDAVAAGPRDVARVRVGDDSLAMEWAGALAEPELAGPRATYREALEGVDLVFEATRTGFEQFFVVKDRAAAARVATVRLPLRSAKLRFVNDAPGAFSIRDASGASVGRIPTPMAWDAAAERASGPRAQVALGVATRARGKVARRDASAGAAAGAAAPGGAGPGGAGTGAAARSNSRSAAAAAVTGDAAEGTGGFELELSADAGWLNDPARQYPVTLDPKIQVGPVKDAYVRSDLSGDHSGDPDLQLGFGRVAATGAQWVARSLLSWDTAYLAGARVLSANLYLYNYYSVACGTPWDLYNVGAFTVPVNWASQPAWDPAALSSTTMTKGGPGCADGYVNVDATPFFRNAADKGLPTAYMGLRAPNEGDINQFKNFYASERGSAVLPNLWIAYEAAPLLTDPQVQPSTGGCGAGAGRAYVTSLTPQLRTTVSHEDSTTASVSFEWWVTGGNKIGSTTVSNVPSGTVASATIPAGALAEGGTYSWGVVANNGTLNSLSKWCEFTVDTVRPKVPFVSSAVYPSTATNNTWGRGGAGQAADFTFTPATGDADVAAYVYQQDLDAAATTVAATGPLTVSLTPKEDGRRTLTVRSKDRAGNLSDPATYTFNVGRAGLKFPAPGANVVKRMKLGIDGDATYTKVRFRYRRGPGAQDMDVPLANLHKANGARATAYPLPIGEVTPNAVWNAMDTLGEVGGVVQVSAKLYTATDGPDAPGYQTQWTTVTVDSNGDGAAATEVGPASVNLLTGDATVSSSDVDEFGLSVDRVASSREPADGWTPQGERLSAAMQQVTNLAGFSGEGTADLGLATTLGHGSSKDSLEITPVRANSDTFAAFGGDVGGMRLDMKPGKRYRAKGWIYVPAATGLTGTHADRGLRIVGFALNSAGTFQESRSPKATWTDGWQELTVDMAIPAGATQAFFRVYNGMPGGSGKKVYWDDLSVREVVAPFGPQWRGGAADGVGSSDYTTLELPSKDLVKINTTGGGWLTFAPGNAGLFFPEPGAEDLTLTKVNEDVFRLSDLDGTVTEFGKQGNTYVVTTTWTADSASSSRYLYDSSDHRTLVKRVINPVEPGVGDCTTPTPARGCEVLEYDYATATTATAAVRGDVVDQVRSVKVWSWDPKANANVGAQTAAEVARYTYDDQGGLREVWDPRLAAPLKTTYTYDSAGRVTSVTTAGQLPWNFDYGTAAGDSNPGRLLRVRRAALKVGTRDQLDGEVFTKIVYGVPLTRATGGPHDMNAETIRRWGQRDLPTDATAVFGPESDPGTYTATATTPGSGGYTYATINYLDASGAQVNAASPGGHIDTTDYDQFGNVVRTLEATNRELALGTLPDAAAKAAELNLPADSALRADLLSTVNTYSPDGLDLVQTLGPTVKVALERELAAPGKPTLAPGTQVVARGRSTFAYDEGKPDGAAYHLETTETSGGVVAGYPDADVRTIRTGYSAEKGGTSGWKLRKDTSTTTDAGTAYVVYDNAGRALKSFGVGSTGADARSTVSIFYTAGTNAADSLCGGRPEWAGQPCVTKAAGAIAGQRADMTSELPVKRVVEYDRYGEPAVVAETSNGKTRTTTTTYDGADRVTRVAITSAEGVALPATTSEYDAATGNVAVTRAGNAAISRTYDLLGRVLAYTDADGATTRSEYDRFGKPTKVSDPTGSSTYTYDRVVEPRGMLTSVTDSIAGTFRARYSPDGQLTELKYPGGLTRTDTLDASMAPVGRVFTRDADNATIYAESIVENTQGQWVNHSYTGGSKTYGYDRLGRLTTAKQLAAGSACVTRTYAYDNRTNRTSKRTFTGAGGACRGDGDPDAATAHTYDTADRLTDAGYVYDSFGRVTATPSGLTNAFYANDLVASQREGDTRQDWTLDPATRLRGYTTAKLVNNSWSNASSKLNHYGDDSDEPRWIVEDTTLGSITRNVSGPDADLVATTSKSGDVRLQLTNLHGDVAATIDTGLTSPEFTSYDEFGIPATGQPDQRYGWLGGKQRSAEALGDVILMGVRLYSPGIGRFLQVDPIVGGNSTAYDYCSGDPVNCSDLDGQWGWGSVKKALNKVASVASYASMIPGPIGVFAGVVSAVAYAATGNWKQAAWAVAGAAAAVVGLGGLVKAAHVVYKARRITKAAHAYRKGTSTVGSARASRATAWVAGRMWVGRGAQRKVARNGARWLQKGEYHYRGPARKAFKGKPRWSSNLEYRQAKQPGYKNFHIDHKPPRRWRPWR